MTNFKELELKKVKVIDSETEKTSEKVIAPVVTLDISLLDGQKDKNIDKKWQRFDKEYGQDNSRTDFYVSDDIEFPDNQDESKDPFGNEQYPSVYITDLLSLGRVKENVRKNLDIGLRVIDGSKVETIDSRVTEIVGESNVDKGLSFDTIDDLYTRVVSAYEQIATEEQQKIEEREKERIEAERRAEEEVKAKELEEQQEEESYQDDDGHVEDYGYDEQPIQNGYDDIEYLKNELYAAIDNAVPRVEIPTFENESDSVLRISHDDDYSEMKSITVSRIQEHENKVRALLDAKRQENVDTIYRDLTSEIWDKHLENDKLYNYETQESEFHGQYNQIKEKYDDVIQSVSSKKESEFVRLNKEYQAEKDAFVENAKREAELQFERENKHRIQEGTNLYVETIEDEAVEIYNDQIGALGESIKTTRDKRFYKIVDNTIKENENTIEQATNSISDEIAKVIDELRNVYSNETNDLRLQIQDIEKERVASRKDFDERVQIEVDRETNKFNEERLELEQLRKERQRLLEENARKDEEIRTREARINGAEERLKLAEDDSRKYRDGYQESQTRILDVQRDTIDRVSEASRLNFSPVAAPTMQQIQDGDVESVGNANGQTLYTEKVDSSKGKLIGGMLGAGAIIGMCSFAGSVHESNEYTKLSDAYTQQAKISEKYHSTENADTFKKGDDITIDIDGKLQSAEVQSTKGDSAIVKNKDGKEFKVDY